MLKESWLYLMEYANSIGSLVSAAATLAIAILTVLLWRENKALRKAGSEPKVVAHFEVHPDGTGGLNVALSNVGTGPARNISFSYQADTDEFNKYNIIVDHSLERPAITLIPQGGKISFLFAIGYQLFRPKDASDESPITPLKPFIINVNWHSFDGRNSYSESYIMDVAQFNGLPGMMNKPYLLRIAGELNGISKQIGALKQQASQLVTVIDATTIVVRHRAIKAGNRESQDNKNDDTNKEQE